MKTISGGDIRYVPIPRIEFSDPILDALIGDVLNNTLCEVSCVVNGVQTFISLECGSTC